MPNVVGLNYYEAQQVLAAVGVFIPPGYFELSTISILWMDFGPYSTDVDEMGGENQLTYGGIVTAQSLAAGTLVKRGAPITLTVSNFPMSGLIQ
jgi:beta-lactam-binding protein with PASTA domain